MTLRFTIDDENMWRFHLFSTFKRLFSEQASLCLLGCDVRVRRREGSGFTLFTFV